MFVDSIVNNEHPSPTDNEEIEQSNQSPSNSPEKPETNRQRETIIPTVQIDSVINHNHTEDGGREEEDQLNIKTSDKINEQFLRKDTNEQRKIIL